MFRRTEKGQEYVEHCERVTKNHRGGLNFKPRKVKARMHAIEGDRNPLEFFRLYLSHRPTELRDRGPMYLQIIDNPKGNVWYKTKRMGINSVGTLLQRMVSRTPLKDVPKNFTGHSLRKTSVKRMKSAGYVNSQIRHVTGHSNDQSLDAYDSGDDDEMYGLSLAIANTHKRVPPPPAQEKENVVPRNRSSSSRTFTPQEVLAMQSEDRNFSFGIDNRVASTNWSKNSVIPQEVLKMQSEDKNFSFGVNHLFGSSARSEERNVYIFNSCSDVTIKSGDQKRRKRIRIIESDSD